MNNTPTLTQSEEEDAPWKTIEVNISQCLSTTTTIEVPVDFEDYATKELLEDFVRDQVLLPSDIIDLGRWNVDDFCVMI